MVSYDGCINDPALLSDVDRETALKFIRANQHVYRRRDCELEIVNRETQRVESYVL